LQVETIYTWLSSENLAQFEFVLWIRHKETESRYEKIAKTSSSYRARSNVVERDPSTRCPEWARFVGGAAVEGWDRRRFNIVG
jgi:hypothetical protein